MGRQAVCAGSQSLTDQQRDGQTWKHFLRVQLYPRTEIDYIALHFNF